jgi:hypothetical protein
MPARSLMVTELHKAYRTSVPFLLSSTHSVPKKAAQLYLDMEVYIHVLVIDISVSRKS